MTYLVSRPHTWVTRQEDYMNLFKGNNIQVRDAGSMELPDDPSESLHEAIEEEFEFLIRDPGTIEAAFGEGIQIDAVAAATWAQIADKRSPTFYESVAKRIEHGLRAKVWEFATDNVKERAQP